MTERDYLLRRIGQGIAEAHLLLEGAAYALSALDSIGEPLILREPSARAFLYPLNTASLPPQ